MPDTSSIQQITANHSTIQIDEKAYNSLAASAKWARFLSVAGFALCGVFFVAGVLGGNAIGVLIENKRAGAGTFYSIFSIVFAVLLFFPCLYLFKFSSAIKSSLKGTISFQVGFENLKSCFRFISILVIVLLSLYGLGFVVISVTSIFTR